MDWNSIQVKLKGLGLYSGKIDGIPGSATATGMMAALDKLADLLPRQQSGAVGPAAAVPPPLLSPANSLFDAASAKRLSKAHPLIQKLMNEARKHLPFKVLDSQRGYAAQEIAYKRGHSKAHFGQSAHNWTPSVAVDIVPDPLDWNDLKSFKALQSLIGWYDDKKGAGRGLAKQMEIPIRWGGDWNMNEEHDEKLVDMPHYELHPWRNYAEKLYEG